MSLKGMANTQIVTVKTNCAESSQGKEKRIKEDVF